MEKEWLYIDKIDSLPSTDYVHCDTRDFHILCTNDSVRITKWAQDFKKELRHCMHQDKFMFRRDEILGTLKALEMGSGGPGDWRMLRLKQSGHYNIGWLKYIRFAAVDTVEVVGRTERVYVAYAEDAGKYAQLSREDLVPENLDNEYLNHIPWDPNEDPQERKDSKSEVIQRKTLDDLEKVL